jgi:hypothetical protein
LRSAGTCALVSPSETSKSSSPNGGIEVDHVSIFRWVQRFAPEFAQAARARQHLVGDRWHVDEAYVRVGGTWRYLFRAIDQSRATSLTLRPASISRTLRRNSGGYPRLPIPVLPFPGDKNPITELNQTGGRPAVEIDSGAPRYVRAIAQDDVPRECATGCRGW